MKRTFLLLFFTLVVAANGMSQRVVMKINEGLPGKQALKTKMESEIGKLLTEFNDAAREKRDLNVSHISMTPQARKDICAMYNFLPFVCDDPAYTERCISTVTGYCIRGILVSIVPQPDYHDSLERELTVNFSPDGQITGAVFSLPHHITNPDGPIMRGAKEVEDVARRNEILTFVENYRSYYDKKDIAMLDSIFSDDAIVITGKVMYRKVNEYGKLIKDVVYKQQDKKQYLDNLRNSVFKNNKYIRVKFDDIEVVRHPTNSKVYVVTLQQDWDSQKYTGTKYHDEGFVTLVWEFSEQGKDPQILFRSWQSNDIIEGNDDNVFKWSDFDVPMHR